MKHLWTGHVGHHAVCKIQVIIHIIPTYVLTFHDIEDYELPTVLPLARGFTFLKASLKVVDKQEANEMK